MSVEFINFPDKAEPLTSETALAECLVAGTDFRSLQEKILKTDKQLFVRSNAWISQEDFERAVAEEVNLQSAGKTLLAWSKEGFNEADGLDAESSFEVFYAWDLLKVNEQVIGALSEDNVEGEIHPAANIEGVINIGEGTRILPGVFIEGNVIIGKNCKIGPNCYIRGNTFIGDNCHIGQSVEIKNSIIMTKTNVGHLSYIGDSVLGENVNFGAGTTTSNLRHDNGNHRSLIDNELVDTGRRKFGVVIGKGAHTGINTSFYPGRKMWPGTTTLPGEIIKYDRVKS